MPDTPLKPCPFCGAGETIFREYPLNNAPSMSGKPQTIISVEIMHWCEKVPGVVHTHRSVRGRDRETTVAAWNRRSERHDG